MSSWVSETFNLATSPICLSGYQSDFGRSKEARACDDDFEHMPLTEVWREFADYETLGVDKIAGKDLAGLDIKKLDNL